MKDPATVRAISAADEADWRRLWAGYCAFYKSRIPAAVTDATWRRILDPGHPMFARIAEQGGAVVGFACCTVHETSWRLEPSCYLEDLFVLPVARGTGAGRALIEDLIALSAERGWTRLYWHTARDNETARKLYDRFSPADAFVRYRLSF